MEETTVKRQRSTEVGNSKKVSKPAILWEFEIAFSSIAKIDWAINFGKKKSWICDSEEIIQFTTKLKWCDFLFVIDFSVCENEK